MEWNRKVVDPAKVTSRNAKLGTLSLADASVAKHDKL
jgi:hypothetical protein